LSAVAGAHDDLRRLIDRPWATSRLVDFYPEASAVVECLDDSGQVVAYAKVHAGDEGERTYRIQELLARRAQGAWLRTARPLAYSKQFRTLVVEPIVGESVRRLKGARLLAGLRAYGAALAALHSVPVNDGTRDTRDALGRLLHRAGGIRMVRPDVEEAFVALLEDLRLRWGDASGERVFVHGDTNENNAILQGDRVALIDFDRTSVGSAGADLGNFLGLLRYYRILDLVTPQSERARAAAFLGGYSSVRPVPDRDSLRVHESAALAERAARAVTRLRARASQRIPSLLHEARELLR
jgi:Ser/Thr protein kinase RdoA (MazF antagonist)